MNLGSCTVIRKLAQGGVADIYLAKATEAGGSEKYLVCKCIRQDLKEDPSILSGVQNEVRLCMKLRHPNILEVFDLCRSEDNVFMLMEYMDAMDLGHLGRLCRERHEKIPPEMVMYVVDQAARGLHEAHELKGDDGVPLGLVHRDVSPENILFNHSGDVKVADFGIAVTDKIQESTSDDDMIEGKFNYMSPEQAWGDRVDRRSDIFSLAVVMYEAWLGISFYPDHSESETIQCAQFALFRKPSEVDPDFPQDVEDVLLKALDMDKKLRYGTMDEFRQALETCMQHHGWKVSRDQWVAWLGERIVFPDLGLPLMRWMDYVRNGESI